MEVIGTKTHRVSHCFASTCPVLYQCFKVGKPTAGAGLRPHLSKQAWLTVNMGLMLAAEFLTWPDERPMPYSTDDGLIAKSADIMSIC
jgi:hypothetical protein